MARYTNIAVAAAIVVMAALAFMLLPSGYDADLSKVGQGQPAVVLVHDHGLVQSIELMDALDRIRGDFEPETLFLVASAGHPDGEAFANHHGLNPATLAAFNSSGELTATHAGGSDAEAVRRFVISTRN